MAEGKQRARVEVGHALGEPAERRCEVRAGLTAWAVRDRHGQMAGRVEPPAEDAGDRRGTLDARHEGGDHRAAA